MSNILNISGNKYGLLTVIEEAGRTAEGQVMWRCVCECGAVVEVRGNSLRTGNTKSCGCHKRKVLGEMHLIHGASSHGKEDGAYIVWKTMRQRCLNPKNPNWSDYGGRGITICQSWLDSYDAFIADMGPRPAGYTIERLDTNGNYDPSNCIWATRRQQSRNTRQVLRITLCGQMIPLVVACEKFGINHGSVKARMRRESESQIEAFCFLLDRKLSLDGDAA